MKYNYFKKIIYDYHITKEFYRFVVVGVLNTVHHYLWYLTLKNWIAFDIANVIAYVMSTIGSFFLNCYFTYKVKPSFKKFFQYPIVSAFQLLIAYIIPKVSVELFGINDIVAPLLTVVSVPIVFILSRYVLKKEDRTEPVSKFQNH